MQDVFETRSIHAPERYEPGFSQEPAAWFRREEKYAVQMFGFPDRYLPVAIIRSLGSKHPNRASPEYPSPEYPGSKCPSPA
jgi:hypothetical protein